MSRYYNDYEGTDGLYMDDYLEHYGRLGMKWGQHLPDILQFLTGSGRYYGKHKTWKSARQQRKRYKTLKKARKTRATKLAKAKQEVKKSGYTPEILDKIARTGNPDDIRKAANYLSPQQKQIALDQLKFKQSIDEYRANDIKAANAKYTRFMDNAAKAFDTGGKFIDAAKKGYDFYQLISGNGGSKNNNNQNQNKKEKEKGKDEAANNLADVVKKAGKILNDEDKKKK